MREQTILLRTDSSASIGAGHQIRCLAIALEIAQRGKMPLFVVTTVLPFIKKRLQDKGIKIRELDSSGGGIKDALGTIAIAREVGARWIVLDGYSFTDEYHREIKRAGLSLLVIDDLASLQFTFADVIVNPGLSSSRAMYPACNPEALFCLGADYVLLRREFLDCVRPSNRSFDDIKKLFVSLGGACDPQILISVLSVLGESEFNGLNVTVLYGATDPLDLGKLTESNHIDFVQDSPKIASEMVSADLAVSSGGGILWELSFLGIPTLCVVTADNQLPNVASLIERKAIAGLKPTFYFETSSFRETLSYLLSDGDARNTLSRRFDSITDGRGAYRVANLFD